MGQFVGCIEGMAEACTALDFPIVSGNVSLYNESRADDGTGTAILPTPAIGGIGLLADWSRSATIAFKGTGDIILAVGATPLAITNCLNFANPQRPEIMGQIVGCLEGMGDACRALDFPIVSGNVSLYNESKATGGGSAILPTPAIGGVGLLKDWTKNATIAFKGIGDVILVIGTRGGHLGQSVWLRECHGREEGPPPPVDLVAERKTGDLIRDGIINGQLSAVHDVSDGGIAVTLAEMALAGNIGAMIDRKQPFGCAASFFAEDQGVYVVTVHDHALLDFLGAAHAAGVEAEPLGRTGGKRLIFERPDRDDVVAIDDLRSAHEGFFPKLMGADAVLA
jgi:phosphoribosylformylglycinamidine synthase